MFKHPKLILVSVFTSIIAIGLFLSFAKTAKASALQNISATVANSRMSFRAPVVGTGVTAGTSLITISGAAPGDTTTNHLFPGDKVCFTDAGNNVCRDNTTYTVDNVPSTTTFNVSSPIATNLVSTDYVVATQSGTWTIVFTTVNTVPIGGKLVITIPANTTNSQTQNNDGMPDANASVATNGFDMNNITTADATVSNAAGSCTAADWGSSNAATSIGVGATGSSSTITWNRVTSTCGVGSTITVTIAGNGIVNPAPITGHTQGTADIYGITVATQDSGSNTIDSAVPRVAPVEGVLVSGTVDETLSFVVAGVGTGTTATCGQTTTITTTATAIPWGHFAASNTFYYGAQNLTVSTNGASGYAVTIQESDQMGKNGNVCTGTSPAANGYTYGSGICIRDTTCDVVSCTSTSAQDWTSASSYPGLGYSENNKSGTDAAFHYDDTATFAARQLPDKTEGGVAAQTIMSNAGPVNGSSVDVCYKITISPTQPAGYYYNIVKYTATATF